MAKGPKIKWDQNEKIKWDSNPYKWTDVFVLIQGGAAVGAGATVISDQKKD